MRQMTYGMRHMAHGAPLDPRNERGMAIVVALMAMLLLSALGAGLVLTTSTETLITANYRDSSEAMYAADAGVERVLQDLLNEYQQAQSWNLVLAGGKRSPFNDGAPSGERSTPFGGTIDLSKATNMLNCAKVTTCSDADMNARTHERPWSANNPRWQLYAYGPLASIIPTGTVVSPMYVIVWVGDDPSETDNDPTKDGDPGVDDDPEEDENTNPGRGQINLRAEAFGPGGIHKAIEVTVGVSGTTADVESGYLAQRGQDEQNRRSRRLAVGTPEKALGRSEMGLTTGGMGSQ
jgi:hypothetical protein